MGITAVLAIMETLLYVFLYYIFVNHFNKYDISKRRYIYIWILLTAGTKIVGVCLNTYDTNVHFDRSIFYTVLQIIFLFTMNREFENSFCKIVIGMQYITSIFLLRQFVCEYVCWFIEKYSQNINDSNYRLTVICLQVYYLSMCISEVLFLVIIFFVTKRKKIECVSRKLFVCEIALYCSAYIMQKAVIDSNQGFMILVNALLFVLSILIFVIMYQYSCLKIVHTEKKFLEEELKNAEKLYENIQDGQNTIRNIRHDMKNRLIGILGAVHGQERSWEKVQQEIEKIVGEIDGINIQRYCDDTKINSILHNKLKNVDMKKIDINIKIMYLEKLNIDYGDIGVIIGNLLDNAIEACNYVYTTKPYILIKGYEHGGYWYFVIENSKSNTRPLKTSVEHGRGIKNVQRVLEKYHAAIRIEEREEKYKTEVKFMIGLPRE